MNLKVYSSLLSSLCFRASRFREILDLWDQVLRAGEAAALFVAGPGWDQDLQLPSQRRLLELLAERAAGAQQATGHAPVLVFAEASAVSAIKGLLALRVPDLTDVTVLPARERAEGGWASVTLGAALEAVALARDWWAARPKVAFLHVCELGALIAPLDPELVGAAKDGADVVLPAAPCESALGSLRMFLGRDANDLVHASSGTETAHVWPNPATHAFLTEFKAEET